MSIIRNLLVRISADTQDLRAGLSEMQRSLNSVSRPLNDLGGALTRNITLPIAAAGVGIIKTAADFEAGMSNIKAVSGATATEMKQFEKLALKMGADTKFSALEAAQGIEELSKAGLTTTQILDGGLNGALSLAAAGEIELADAAEIASTALNAFRKDNMSVMDAANLLAGAANASATDITELRYGLSMVSAVASGMGASFKDTTTALALFANYGLKGSDAGTSLKTMLNNLVPKTDKAIGAFQDLGIITKEGKNQFFDANGSIRSMSEIAGILKSALGSLSDEQRQLALYTMFGSDAIRAGNIMFEAGAEGITKMYDAMSTTTADEVAKTKMDNFKGSVEQLKGSLETLGIQLGTILLPYLKSFADKLTELTNGFMLLSPETQKTILIVAGIAAAVGPIILILGKLIESVQLIIGGFSSLAGIIGAIATPIAIALVAVAALVAGFLWLWNTNEEFRTNMTNLWAEISIILSGIWSGIVIIAKTIWGALQSFWVVWGGTITSLLSNVFYGLGGIVKGALEIVQGIVSIISGIISGDWSRVWEGIKQVFIGIWNVIKGVCQTVLNAIKLIFTTVWGFILENVLKPVFNWLKNTFGPVFEFLRQVFGVALGLIILGVRTAFNEIRTNIIEPVYNWIKNTLSTVFDIVKTAFDTSCSAIKEILGPIWDGIKAIIEPIYNWFKDTLSPIFDTVKDALNNAWGGLGDTVSNIWTNISNGVKNGVNAVIDIVNGFINKINSIKISIPEMDVPLFGKVGGYTVGFNIPTIPKLATGTNNVPKDMLAMLHEGEAVVPKKYNPNDNSNRPIYIYLGNELIYEGMDSYLGNRIIGQGGY